MGRRLKKVDKQKLIKAIQTAESSGPLKNFNELHTKVADIYNNDSPPEQITFSVVGLRIAEFGLENTLKTRKGKRGRSLGNAPVVGNRQPRSEKFANDEQVQKAFDLLRKNTPSRFDSTVDRVVAGSMAAAVKLKCVDCCGGEGCLDDNSRSLTKEIRECQIVDCSLWAFRPYQ